jgi:hypothetical protein
MSSLIRTYGEYWNPNAINWETVGSGNGSGFVGSAKEGEKKERDINCQNAQGIYVLYDNFKAIYVGKSIKTTIALRIKTHLTDRLAGRWDLFSWYATNNIRWTSGDLSQPAGRHNPASVVIDTLEALAILIADPPLNRRRESLSGADELLQKEGKSPLSVRQYLESILDRLPDNKKSPSDLNRKDGP